MSWKWEKCFYTVSEFCTSIDGKQVWAIGLYTWPHGDVDRCWHCLCYCCCQSFKRSFQQDLRHIWVFRFGFRQKTYQPLMTACVIVQWCCLYRPPVLYNRVSNSICPKQYVFIIINCKEDFVTSSFQYTVILQWFMIFTFEQLWSILKGHTWHLHGVRHFWVFLFKMTQAVSHIEYFCTIQ